MGVASESVASDILASDYGVERLAVMATELWVLLLRVRKWLLKAVKTTKSAAVAAAIQFGVPSWRSGARGGAFLKIQLRGKSIGFQQSTEKGSTTVKIDYDFEPKT